jgi:hypothetical protein
MNATLLSLCVLFCSYSITAFRVHLFSKGLVGKVKYRSDLSSAVPDTVLQNEKVFDEAKVNQKLLYTIPNSPVPIHSVVSYVHKWATEATATGSSIKADKNSEGVQFSFSPSPSSYLNVYVDTDGVDSTRSEGSTVFIRTSFGILAGDPTAIEEQKKKTQVHSLIKMVADNLIESLANDIGSLIMNNPESSSFSQELSPAEKEEQNLADLEREQIEYDENMQEEDELQLRGQVYAEQQSEQQSEQREESMSEKDRTERLISDVETMKESLKEHLLTEKEVMKEWTAESVTDEDNRLFIEEMRKRNGQGEEGSPIFDNDSQGITDEETEEEIVIDVEGDVQKEAQKEVEVMVKKDEEVIEKKEKGSSIKSAVVPTVSKNTPAPSILSSKKEKDVIQESTAPVVQVPEKTSITVADKNKEKVLFFWESVETEESVLISFIQGNHALSFVLFICHTMLSFIFYLFIVISSVLIIFM